MRLRSELDRESEDRLFVRDRSSVRSTRKAKMWRTHNAWTRLSKRGQCKSLMVKFKERRKSARMLQKKHSGSRNKCNEKAYLRVQEGSEGQVLGFDRDC